MNAFNTLQHASNQPVFSGFEIITQTEISHKAIADFYTNKYIEVRSFLESIADFVSANVTKELPDIFTQYAIKFNLLERDINNLNDDCLKYSITSDLELLAQHGENAVEELEKEMKELHAMAIEIEATYL